MRLGDEIEGSNGNLERVASEGADRLSVSVGSGDRRVVTTWSKATGAIVSVDVGDKVERHLVLPMIHACNYIVRNVIGDSMKGTNT